MKSLPLDSQPDARRIVVETRIVDPADIDDRDIHFCLDYWRACKGGAFAPRWKDFHLDQLPPRVLPYVLVCPSSEYLGQLAG